MYSPYQRLPRIPRTNRPGETWLEANRRRFAEQPHVEPGSDEWSHAPSDATIFVTQEGREWLSDAVNSKTLSQEQNECIQLFLRNNVVGRPLTKSNLYKREQALGSGQYNSLDNFARELFEHGYLTFRLEDETSGYNF